MRLAHDLIALSLTATILTMGAKPAAALDWKQRAQQEQSQLMAQRQALPDSSTCTSNNRPPSGGGRPSSRGPRGRPSTDSGGWTGSG
jgi:hypothetical protein